MESASTKINIGSRIKIPTWGWQKASVISLHPLVVQFDHANKPTKLTVDTPLEPLAVYPELKQGLRIKVNHKHFVATG